MALKTVAQGPMGVLLGEHAGKDDPTALASQFHSVMMQTNPPDDSGEDLDARLNRLLYEAKAKGINTTSWDEDDWFLALSNAGFTSDDMGDAFDIIASWGVDDDNTDVVG